MYSLRSIQYCLGHLPRTSIKAKRKRSDVFTAAQPMESLADARSLTYWCNVYAEPGCLQSLKMQLQLIRTNSGKWCAVTCLPRLQPVLSYNTPHKKNSTGPQSLMSSSQRRIRSFHLQCYWRDRSLSVRFDSMAAF
jgi:hypothetical protein